MASPTLTAEGGHRERTVDPYSLFLIQGHWYLVGRDHLRDALRTFRVGRIKGSVRFPTEKPRDFTIPEDYDPEAVPRPAALADRPGGRHRDRQGDGRSGLVGQAPRTPRQLAGGR